MSSLTSGAYNLVFYVALFWIAGVTAITRAVPPFLQMVIDAISLLYIGSYLSLKFFNFVTKPQAAVSTEKPLSSDEGWKMPLVAACVLIGLFTLFKYIGKNYVNYALVGYFSLLGVNAIKFWIDILTEKLKILDGAKKLAICKIEIFRWCPGVFELSAFDICGYIIAAIIVVIYVIFRDWASNNIIGAAFCLYGFENIYIGRFTTAFLMLGLFFLYDIFFVFGTTIMVTIAMGIDGPIKLAFPRVLDPRVSILGLGDILVPGLLLTLCLRFDLVLHVRKLLAKTDATIKEVFPKSASEFSKPYFITCFIGYIIGIIVTIAVGVIYNAAQPALLYLVPLTVLPVTIMGLLRGEISEMIWYDESAEEEKIKKIMKKK